MIDSELIPLKFHKIIQSPIYTLFILGTSTRQFAIYTSAHVGNQIRIHLTNQAKTRPHGSDLIRAIFKGLHIKILHIVINDVQDTIYYVRLLIEQQVGEKRTIMEIDVRPSDCFSIVFEENVPIFCTKEVLDKVIEIE